MIFSCAHNVLLLLLLLKEEISPLLFREYRLLSPPIHDIEVKKNFLQKFRHTLECVCVRAENPGIINKGCGHRRIPPPCISMHIAG